MKSKKKYFENLDASRFFAFFFVFLSHALVSKNVELSNSSMFLTIQEWSKLGFFGFEYFFVLSSFLISWIILEEKKNTQNFNMRNFLVRRSLRVWPLYFLVVLVGYSGFYFAKCYLIELEGLPPIHYFLFFIVNFYIIFNGTDFLFLLVFLWTISIEEQFYLMWALVMKYIKLNLLWLGSILIIISIIFRVYYVGNGSEMYFHTLSAFGNFGVGAIVAHLVFFESKIFELIVNINKNISKVIYLVLFLSIFFFHQLNQFELFHIFSRLYFSILFGFYILEQAFAMDKVFNGGKFRVFTNLGKISYGLYCYHGIVITILIKTIEQLHFTETYWHIFVIYPILIIALTIGISRLSYRYFESYFLQLKSRF